MRKEQRLTLVLGVAAGLLAALAIAQRFGLGSGYTLLPPAPPSEGGVTRSAPKVEPVKLAAWDSPDYHDLVERPMFNEDRKPTPASATAGPDATEAKPLNVTLTGIILTNGVKIAMIRDNASGKSARLKIGMPLPGEQAAWKLTDVHARSAVFDAPNQTQQELRLQINDKAAPMAMTPPPPQPAAGAAQPPQPAPPPQPAAPVDFGPSGTQPPPGMAAGGANNADEIRRRIEERRKQLREEAQRMSNQEQQQKQ